MRPVRAFLVCENPCYLLILTVQPANIFHHALTCTVKPFTASVKLNPVNHPASEARRFGLVIGLAE